MRQVKRGREVVSFTKGFSREKSAMLFPHSVATKEYICHIFGVLLSFL